MVTAFWGVITLRGQGGFQGDIPRPQLLQSESCCSTSFVARLAAGYLRLVDICDLHNRPIVQHVCWHNVLWRRPQLGNLFLLLSIVTGNRASFFLVVMLVEPEL